MYCMVSFLSNPVYQFGRSLSGPGFGHVCVCMCVHACTSVCVCVCVCFLTAWHATR